MTDLDRLPFPVAHPLYWVRDPNQTLAPQDRLANGIFAAYQTMRLATLLMLSAYMDDDDRDDSLAEKIRGLRLPHWQEWTRLADGLVAFWMAPQAPERMDRCPVAAVVRGWADASCPNITRKKGKRPKPEARWLPLIEGLSGPNGRTAGSANEALWGLRNRRAHRQGTVTPDAAAEAEAEEARILPLVEGIVASVFGDASLTLVRAVEGTGGEVDRIIHLTGPHPDLTFPAEAPDPAWAEALEETEVAVLLPDTEALPVYPLLVPTDDETDPEAAQALAGLEDPVALIDGVSEARLTLMGVRHAAEVKSRHLSVALARLREKHADLSLRRDKVAPWTIAAWSRMTATQTLDELRERKYFPAFYLERAGIDAQVTALGARPGKALVLLGEAGTGKSSLLARLVDRLIGEGDDDDPDHDDAHDTSAAILDGRAETPDVVVYCSGTAEFAGDAGLDGATLLTRIVARKLGIRAEDFASLADLLRHLDATGRKDDIRDRRLWLVLDGLNEADRFVDLVRALDDVLPLLAELSFVRLVVSLRTGAYLSLQGRKDTLGSHDARVFSHDGALSWFPDPAAPDDRTRDRPYLDVRPFRPEPEGREAYDRRRAALPHRAADVAHDRLYPNLRTLLLTPLYLHLFHETFAGQQAGAGAALDLSEGAVLDAYLDHVGRGGGGAALLDRLSALMLDTRAAVLPTDTAQDWTEAWRQENGFSSVHTVAKLDPVEELVSASVLMRPVQQGVGTARDVTGYRFTMQRLAERVLLRTLDASIAPRALPTGDDLMAWAARVPGPPYFDELTGALGDWVERLTLAVETDALARLIDLDDETIRTRLIGTAILATAGMEEADVEKVAETLTTGQPKAVVASVISACWGHLNKLAMIAPGFVERAWWERVEAILRQHLDATPENVSYIVQLGYACWRLGLLAKVQKDRIKSKEWMNEAIETQSILLAFDPDSPLFRLNYCVIALDIGEISRGPSERHLWVVKALRESAAPDSLAAIPNKYWSGWALVYGKFGHWFLESGDYEQAKKWLTTAFETHQALVNLDPSDTRSRRNLALATYSLAELYFSLGDTKKSKDLCAKTIDALQAEYDKFSSLSFNQVVLMLAYELLGEAAASEHDTREAEKWFVKTLQLNQSLVRLDPNNPVYIGNIRKTYSRLGNLALDAGNGAEAKTWFTKGIEVAEALAKLDPGNATWAAACALSQLTLSDLEGAPERRLWRIQQARSALAPFHSAGRMDRRMQQMWDWIEKHLPPDSKGPPA